MITLMLALKLTLLFSLAGLVALALRRERAAVRHLLWGLSLTGAVALPFLASVSPRVELPVLPAVESEPSALPSANAAAPMSVLSDAGETSVDVAPAGSNAQPSAGLRAGVSADLPWLVIGWGAGSLVVLLLVAASLIATLRLSRRTNTVTDGPLQRDLDDCRALLQLRRPVRLLLSQDQVMPMTWGARRPTVLLPAAATEWSSARRRDVLLHELAHVRRLDWLSQLLARLVCAAYWWHPLSWYAAQRMREERELACDDLVLVHGANAADYAHHLLSIAKDFRASAATRLATVAMARPSQLAGRLLAVLDATRRRSGVTRAHLSAALTATAAVVLLLAGLTAVSANIGTAATPPSTTEAAPVSVPTLPPQSAAAAAPAAPAPMLAASTLCDWTGSGERSSSHSNINDDRATIRITLNDCEMSLRSSGDVRFSADERDVAALGAGDWFELEERGERSARRRAEFEGRDGGIQRRYFVDGRESAWDADAQAWFQSALLVMFRRTSFQAQERAERIYARGGRAAVLAEVDNLYSSSALAKYIGLVAERERLSPAETRRITALAADRISSSSALGGVLRLMLQNPALDDAVRVAVVDASTRISSSSERASVLIAATEQRPFTSTLADAVLRSAADISSSSARSEVLTSVGAQLPADVALPNSYLQAARGVSSSSALGGVLVTLVERDRLSDERVLSVLDIAGSISSSSERVRVLEALLEQHRVNVRTSGAFFSVVDGISSSAGKGDVLRALIETQPEAGVVERLLAAVGTISSSSERGSVLVAAAQGGLISTPALRAQYERVAAEISSRSERDRALEALRGRRI